MMMTGMEESNSRIRRSSSIPLHARQPHVGEHHVGAERLDEPDGLLPIGGDLGLVAGLEEERLHRAGQGPLVVHDEHGAAHASAPPRAAEPAPWCPSPARCRSPIVLRSAPRSAWRWPDRARCPPGRVVKNGSHTDGSTLRRDAGTGVGYLDHHPRRRASLRSADSAPTPEAPALGHGVEGVGDQLEQRLLQLHRIHPYRWKVAGQLELELDLALPHRLGDGGAGGSPPGARPAQPSGGRAPAG